MEIQKFDYRSVRFAGAVKAGEDKALGIAKQFETLLNHQMNDGFEYYRMDVCTVYEMPGCVAGLFGGRPVAFSYSLAVFRRPKA